MSDDLYARMSESDAAYRDEIQWQKDVQMRPIRPRVISQRVRSAALAPLGKMVSIVHKVPDGEVLTRTVSPAALGPVELAVSVSEASVRRKRTLKAHRSAGSNVWTLQDIRSLTLDDVLIVKPRLSLAYSATVATKGVVSSILVLDGFVAAALGIGVASALGVGVTASVIVADITGFLAAVTRLVARMAMYHGYDSEDSIERPFSMTVLLQAISLTGSGRDSVVEKQATMLAFNKVIHNFARRGSLDGLDSNVVVSAMNSFSSVMGMHLASCKLVQIVPVAGVVMSAGLNAALVCTIGETVDHLYRECLLTRRYGRMEPGDSASTDLVGLVDTRELGIDIARYMEIAEIRSRP